MVTIENDEIELYDVVDWSQFVGHTVKLTYDGLEVGYATVLDENGACRCNITDEEKWKRIHPNNDRYSVQN
jgi:hypothetical protein